MWRARRGKSQGSKTFWSQTQSSFGQFFPNERTSWVTSRKYWCDLTRNFLTIGWHRGNLICACASVFFWHHVSYYFLPEGGRYALPPAPWSSAAVLQSGKLKRIAPKHQTCWDVAARPRPEIGCNKQPGISTCLRALTYIEGRSCDLPV